MALSVSAAGSYVSPTGDGDHAVMLRPFHHSFE
jgi:hypothetical protein